MPWWWVIPAAISGYYLYKEVASDEDSDATTGLDRESPIEPGAGSDQIDESASRLPGWARKIEPLGLGAFLRRHGHRFFPADRPRAAPEESRVPSATPRVPRSRVLGWVQLLFLPASVAAILALWALGLAGTSVLWVVVWGGVIGYATNWLAVKMLFHPRKRRPLWPWKGVIPARRDEILDRVTDGVTANLINETILREYLVSSGLVEAFARAHGESMRQVIDDPAFRKDFEDLVLGFVVRVLESPRFRDEILAAIEARVDAWAGREFSGKVAAFAVGWAKPQLAREIGSLLENLPSAGSRIREHANRLLDELPRLAKASNADLELVLSRFFVGVLERIDVRAIVKSQLSRFTDDQFEAWVTRTAARELDVITLLGGFLGLAGGLVIAEPVQGLYLAGAAALLWALDRALGAVGRRA